MSQDNGKITVTIDEDLEDLIPAFLENRGKDVRQIGEELKKGDFDNIRILGHSMKGSGGGYGFDQITEIGAVLEQAAKEQNIDEIKKPLEELKNYLNNLEIIYE